MFVSGILSFTVIVVIERSIFVLEICFVVDVMFRIIRPKRSRECRDISFIKFHNIDVVSGGVGRFLSPFARFPLFFCFPMFVRFPLFSPRAVDGGVTRVFRRRSLTIIVMNTIVFITAGYFCLHRGGGDWCFI